MEGGGRQPFFGRTTLRNHASSSRSTFWIISMEIISIKEDDKYRKSTQKAGMIFFLTIIVVKQATLYQILEARMFTSRGLPSLLFATELFTLNASQLTKLERCQQWFLKTIFYVPNFAPNTPTQTFWCKLHRVGN